MGTAALYQTSNTDSFIFPANSSHYTNVGTGAYFEASLFEAQDRSLWRTAGVWSNLWANVTLNNFDLTSNGFSRINGSDGNQTIAVPAATTGFFQDTTNTDAISPGDVVSYRFLSSHSGPNLTGFRISIFQSLFTATAAERVYRLTSGNSGAPRTGFLALMAGFQWQNSESLIQTHVPGGTARNAAITISLQTRNGNSTLVLRVNETDTALIIDIPTTTSGTFEDLVNTVTLFDRDRVNWRFVRGGTSGVFFTYFWGMDLLTTVFFGGGSRTGAGVQLKGGATGKLKDGFGPHSGWHDQVQVADESDAQAEALVTDTWEGIIVQIPTNGQNGTCEWISRKDGSDDTIVVTVTAFTTGIFESVGASVAVTPTSLIDIRRKANGDNSDALIYYTHNFFGVGGAPPAPPTFLGGIYRLIPDRTKDTIYTGFGPTTTEDRKIPDPFIKTGLIGE